MTPDEQAAATDVLDATERRYFNENVTDYVVGNDDDTATGWGGTMSTLASSINGNSDSEHNDYVAAKSGSKTCIGGRPISVR